MLTAMYEAVFAYHESHDPTVLIEFAEAARLTAIVHFLAGLREVLGKCTEALWTSRAPIGRHRRGTLDLTSVGSPHRSPARAHRRHPFVQRRGPGPHVQRRPHRRGRELASRGEHRAVSGSRLQRVDPARSSRLAASASSDGSRNVCVSTAVPWEPTKSEIARSWASFRPSAPNCSSSHAIGRVIRRLMSSCSPPFSSSEHNVPCGQPKLRDQLALV